MTLGEYPEKVPPQVPDPDRAVPLEGRRGPVRERGAAGRPGRARGPNLAGGSIFDDFNGDGLPDLFTTSLDADRGASLFVNRGDGTFEDRSAVGRARRPGLRAERRPRRLRQRRRPRRAAAARRLGEAAAALAPAEQGGRSLRGCDGRQRAGRADRDRVGRLGRLRQRRLASTCSSAASTSRPAGDAPRRRRRDPPQPLPALSQPGRRHVRRRRRRGRRRSTSGAPRGRPGATTTTTAGSTSSSRTWARPCRLYHNEGDGTFRDVAPELGVTGADLSFACWFWDYDNDGRLDLFVNDYRRPVAEVAGRAPWA